MAGRYVRSSSFRHVHGEIAKPEFQFMGNLRLTGKQLTANDKYWAGACAGGGGPVAVAEIDKPGRHNNYFHVAVHGGEVLDAQFNPHAVNLLCTASNDAYIKLCTIPDGQLIADDGKAVENVTKADRELQGHYKKVDFVRWNPTASNVIASASSDCTVKIWDIENQSEITECSRDGIDPTSLAWNSNGSMLAVGDKNTGGFSLYDPRTEGHGPQKGFDKKLLGTTFVFADNHNMLIGIGRNNSNLRQWKMWDLKKLDTPVGTKDIDSSAGILYPFYDPDCSILYLAGAGDSGISYWELADGTLHFLTQFQDTKPQKTVAWRPKRSLNTKTCEIAGALRVIANNNVHNVVPVSFQVPRKSDLFQKDLYPDTEAGLPGCTLDEWKTGVNGEVKKQSMKPGDAVAEKVAVKVEKKKTAAEYEAEIEALKAEVARLKKLAGEA